MKAFTIYGEVASKKNGKQILYKWKSNKRVPFIANSDRYHKWNEDAKQQLMIQRNLTHGFSTDRCKIVLDFYYGTQINKDADNGTSSIFDTLKDVGIITDDNWHIIPTHLVHAYYDKLQPRVEIFIYDIDEHVTIEL